MALADIDHIVVLVLENRSFDHVLGYLGLEGYQGADGNALDGLRPGMSNPLHGIPQPIFELGSTVFSPGPHHHYEHVRAQLAGQNQGFVSDYATQHGSHPGQVMGYHTGRTLRVFDALARQYGVCDRWFSAIPGPTWPNRFFLMAGHSNGVVENLRRIDADTIFDRLGREGVSWRYYSHDIAFLRTVEHFTFSVGKISKIRQFYADLAAGTLPSIAWIDPNFTLQGALDLPDGGNDDHPPADVRNGQNLVADVYNALVTNPEVWKKTLLVVTYDEHGGFFDHVPPPVHPERSPRGDPQFDRFGVRVPALILSPWVRRGTVWSRELEHTSIVRTILQRFCASGGVVPDMGERVNGAPDLGFLLDAPAARTDCAPVDRIEIAAPPGLDLLSAGGEVAGFRGAPPVVHESSSLDTLLMEIRAEALANGVPHDEM
jgi:phospholipase C